MTLTRRRVLAAASLGAASVGAAAPAATLAEFGRRGFIAVATQDDYEPFEYARDGKRTGYDQDLLDLVRPRLPFAIRQEIVPWSAILPGVASGKYDLAATAVLATPARLRGFAFCAPVAESAEYYLRRADDGRLAGVADLAGRRIGLHGGAVAQRVRPQIEAALKQTGGAPGEVVEYDDDSAAYSDLADGRLDAVVNTRLSLQAVLATRPRLFAIGQRIGAPTYIAWALRRDGLGLSAQIDEVLLGARRDGTLRTLQLRYFGMAFEDLPDSLAAPA